MTRVLAISLALAAAMLCLCAGTASASAVLVVRDGRVHVEEDPYLPPASATELPPAPGAGAAGTPTARAARTTVSGALKKALRAKQIKQADHDSYLKIYKDARKARKKAGSRCRIQLRSVLVMLERLAGNGQLTASRMPVLFLQLMHNTNFWTMSPKPQIDAGDRVTFDKSPVVFQHYKRQGLQIQPLANFGKANGLWKACQEAEQDPTSERSCRRKALRRLLSRMSSLASKRGGVTAWEYFFSFSGGRPPWASGMAQATGIQALARGSEMFDNKRYARTASSALGLFEKRPPVGVKVRSGRGAHYLLYTFSPGLRVLNAFVQTLVGLRDFSTIAGSDKAKVLFKRGDRALRKELPKYDTGDWSLYSIKGAEASYSYHELVTEFLENLCERTGVKTYCRYAKRFRNYLEKREKPGPGEPSPRSCGVT